MCKFKCSTKYTKSLLLLSLIWLTACGGEEIKKICCSFNGSNSSSINMTFSSDNSEISSSEFLSSDQASSQYSYSLSSTMDASSLNSSSISSESGFIIDITPDAFNFPRVDDSELNTEYKTTGFVVTGINMPTSISITGINASYSLGGNDFSVEKGVVSEGQVVFIKATSSPQYGEPVLVKLDIGNVSATWIITTKEKDETPDTYSFDANNNAQLGHWVESGVTIIAGFDEYLPISVVGGEFSINGSNYTSESSEIKSGDALQLRHKTAKVLSSEKETLVHIGGSATTFRSRTQKNNSIPVWVNTDEIPSIGGVVATREAVNFMFSADVDGDERMDVILDGDIYGFYLCKNTIETFPRFDLMAVDFNKFGALHSPNVIDLVDIDSDGDVDIFTGYVGFDMILLFENRILEGLDFEVKAMPSPGSRPYYLYSSDLDKDQDIDYLVAYAGGGFYWFENDGNLIPEFSGHRLEGEGREQYYVYANDLDGDGDMDIIAGKAEGESDDSLLPRLFWYENDGNENPNFILRINEQLAISGENSAISADLNNDGNMDVILGSFWYENEGVTPLNYIPHTIDGSENLAEAQVLDIDGDGDIDIFNSGVWYENDGAPIPSFVNHRNCNSCRAIVTDIDGDNNVDVVVSENGETVWMPLVQRHNQVSVGADLVFSESALDPDGNSLVFTINENINQNLDAILFSIDSATGELTFNGSQVGVEPQDSNRDNIYEVWITVTDGYSTLNRKIAVEVIE